MAVGTGGTVSSTGGAATNTGGAGTGTGGSAATPATLTGTTTNNFGNVEIGVASAGYTWTVRNTGGSPSGTLALTNSAPSELLVTNNCTGTLAAGAMCTVVVTFKAAAGARSGTLTLTASPGGMVTLGATATGQYRVTVAPTGAGTVTSNPAGITCGTTCTALVAPGTSLTLQARTTNGSNLFFSGWGGACSSPARDCVLVVNASMSVTATFSTMTPNLIFVSSTVVPVNKGSAVAYDAVCNTAATAAGINNAAGNGYVAYISDAASLATTRLGTARGWVRMDGKPFADTVASLLTDRKVFNSIGFSEDGRPASWLLLTGANTDGTLSSSTCQNWTSTSTTEYGNVGTAAGGPGSWGFWNSTTLCSYTATELPMHLICMGTTKSAAVAPVVTNGKRIWVTATGFSPGAGQTPDAKCQADKPAGVTTAAALIAYTNKPASAVLSPTATYVRMDGTVVGTGADLTSASGELASGAGIWQSADGVYRSHQAGGPAGQIAFPYVWTGTWNIGDMGTDATTCGNWANATLTGMQADWTVTHVSWWRVGGSPACTNAYALYCVQTAP